MVDTLGVARDLGADHACRVGLQLGTSDTADRGIVDHLDIERAGRRAIVRTGRVPDGYLGPCGRSLDFGMLVHKLMISIKTGSRQRLYPAKSCAKGGQAMQIGWGLAAQISPAIGVDRLAVDIARPRTAQKPDGGRDVFRLAALAGNGPVDQGVRRL